MKLTHVAAEVDQADVDALREQGLDDAAVSDAIQVVSYFNYVTRVADGVGIESEPEWPRASRARLRSSSAARVRG